MKHQTVYSLIQKLALTALFICCFSGIKAQQNDPKVDELIAQLTAVPNSQAARKVTAAEKLIKYSQATKNYAAETRGKHLLAKFYYLSKEYDNCFKLYSEITNDPRKINSATIGARDSYAFILADAGLLESALELRTLNRDHFLKTKKYLPLSFAESNMAYLYTQLKNSEKAEFHYMKAVDAAKKWGKYYAIASIYNSVGVFYRHQERPNDALNYLNEGLRVIENQSKLEHRDSVLLGYLKGNSGSAYYQVGDKEKAIDYLNQDIHISGACKQYKSMVNAVISLAKIYDEGKEYQKVIHTLDPIFNVQGLEDIEFSRIELHKLYYLAYSQLNNTLKSNEHFLKLEQAWEARDSIKEKIRVDVEHAYVKNTVRIQQERLSNEQRLHKRKMDLVGEREKFNRFRNTIIILSIIVLSLIVIALLRRKIQNNKRDLALFSLRDELAKEKLRIIELEKVSLSSEVRLKNKDLTDFAIDISRKHELLQHVKQEIASLKLIPSAEIEEKIKTLLVYVNNQLIIDQNSIEFQNNIENVNYEFFEALSEKHPSLTQTDRKIAGLIRLNLSNKEIAVMRGVSYKAAKISRYRLRKKMNLDEADDIVEMLQNI